MVSVIILTYNSIKFIGGCLDSVFSQDYQDLETIVIDNGSKDSTVNFIKENYPQVILVENKENLGAAKARNQGIAIAKGGWILALDCDVILAKDFLKKTMGLAKNSGDAAGMFQPKILNADKKTIYSCGIYLSKLRRFYDIGRDKFDNGQFSASKYIFGCCCAAALYKKDMLEQLKEDTGYFDERLFFLVEDVDLSWRAQKKNWKAIFYPEAICYHVGNSAGYSREFRQYLCFRNRDLVIFKNDNKNIIKWFSFMLYDIPRICYLLATNKYTLRALKEARLLRYNFALK